MDGGDGGASACRELLNEDGRATLIAACGTPLWAVVPSSIFASRFRWCSLFFGLRSSQSLENSRDENSSLTPRVRCRVAFRRPRVHAVQVLPHLRRRLGNPHSTHFRALGARSDDLKACSYGQVPLFSSCGDVMRSMIDGADGFDALCQARSGGGH